MRKKETKWGRAKRAMLVCCAALYVALVAYAWTFPQNMPLTEVSSVTVIDTPVPVLLPTMPPAAEPEDAPVQTMNLNTADAWMLCAIPGIGEELAKRIVTYREHVGGFVELSELRRISGIGESTYQRISSYLHCEVVE